MWVGLFPPIAAEWKLHAPDTASWLAVRLHRAGRPDFDRLAFRLPSIAAFNLPSDVSRYIVEAPGIPRFLLRRARWQRDTTCASGTPIARRSLRSCVSTTRMAD